MKKSIISATIRFQSGGIENSCHSFWDSLGVRGGGVCSFRCCSVPLWVAVGPEDDDEVAAAKNMKNKAENADFQSNAAGKGYITILGIAEKC